MWYLDNDPYVCLVWSGGGEGCKVSLCLEIPIGFEYIGLGIEMAKGNLNNAQIKTTFG